MVTREQAQAVCAQGVEAVFELLTTMETMAAELTALRAEVSSLKARLGKDSHNSGKPPSSDGLRRLPRSSRKSSGRQTGGQPGHPGTTLCQREEPDEVIAHGPETCTGCGVGLAQVPTADSGLRRQVFELPPTDLVVTEHRLAEAVCPCCGMRNRGRFPAGVTQSAQYGPRLRAAVTYLTGYQLLPLARTCELLGHLFGCELSEGALVQAQTTCHTALAPVEAAIKTALLGAGLGQFDESGIRVAGRLEWLHVACNRTLTYFSHQPQRGRAAFEAIGLLPRFEGVCVHDAWVSYFDASYPGQHALCGVHLLRELVWLSETGSQTWPQRMMALLRSALKAKKTALEAGQRALEPALLARYEADYRRIVERGLRQNPRPERTGRRGRPKRGPARCLLDRLQLHEDAVLRFLREFGVPFDNNQAERDQRMVKVQQKVSGCFRTSEGADRFCRLRGYLETLRKQQIPILPALTSVFEGQPVYPALGGT